MITPGLAAGSSYMEKEVAMPVQQGKTYRCTEAACGLEVNVTRAAQHGGGGDTLRCCCGHTMTIVP